MVIESAAVTSGASEGCARERAAVTQIFFCQSNYSWPFDPYCGAEDTQTTKTKCAMCMRFGLGACYLRTIPVMNDQQTRDEAARHRINRFRSHMTCSYKKQDPLVTAAATVSYLYYVLDKRISSYYVSAASASSPSRSVIE